MRYLRRRRGERTQLCITPNRRTSSESKGCTHTRVHSVCAVMSHPCVCSDELPEEERGDCGGGLSWWVKPGGGGRCVAW